MNPDHFEATFVVAVDRHTAWERLTGSAAARREGKERLWLPGFDSDATLSARDEERELRATKDDEPCAGTEIVVTLEDDESGTRITVVQSRFGDWMPPMYDQMAVGWRHIVADLQTYLSTGVHARRHLRAWGDLGAAVTPDSGGLRLDPVRDGSLAARLGLLDGDLLVVLGGAPVSNHDDLLTVLRVLGDRPDVSAEWVRAGQLMAATAPAA
jgi:hypothetical protein